MGVGGMILLFTCMHANNIHITWC